MTTNYERTAKDVVKATCTFDWEELKPKVDDVYREVSRTARIPGFRKGHVPRNMLKNFVNEKLVLEDAAEELVRGQLVKIVDEIDEIVVQVNNISFAQLETEKDVIAEVLVSIQPAAVLGECKGLTVEVPQEIVTEDMIDQRIDQDRQRMVTEEDVENRAAEMDDTVYIDYEGFVDGKAFDGGAAQNQPLVLGSNSFIPGFEAGVVGMNPGEEREINVTFPENYHEASLAGKLATFKVILHRIAKQVIPELDDDFAGDVSEFTTFAEYRADIVKQLETRVKEQNDSAAVDAVFGKVVENAEVELNPELVSQEAKRLFDQQAQQYKMYGLDLTEQLRGAGMTAQDFTERFLKGQAESTLRSQLVFEALSKAQNLEATKDQIIELLKKEAKDQDSFNGEEAYEKLDSKMRANYEQQAEQDNLKKFLTTENTVVFVDKKPVDMEEHEAETAEAENAEEETKAEE